MSHNAQRFFWLCILASVTIVITALFLLTFVLGWGVLVVLAGAIGFFVLASLIRDSFQSRRGAKAAKPH